MKRNWNLCRELTSPLMTSSAILRAESRVRGGVPARLLWMCEAKSETMSSSTTKMLGGTCDMRWCFGSLHRSLMSVSHHAASKNLDDVLMSQSSHDL